jgi:hypothetical protein
VFIIGTKEKPEEKKAQGEKGIEAGTKRKREEDDEDEDVKMEEVVCLLA